MEVGLEGGVLEHGRWAGGNIRATAVPGLGSSGQASAAAMESWERAQQRGCASGVHAMHSIIKKEEATGSALSLVYVRISLARCE